MMKVLKLVLGLIAQGLLIFGTTFIQDKYLYACALYIVIGIVTPLWVYYLIDIVLSNSRLQWRRVFFFIYSVLGVLLTAILVSILLGRILWYGVNNTKKINTETISQTTNTEFVEPASEKTFFDKSISLDNVSAYKGELCTALQVVSNGDDADYYLKIQEACYELGLKLDNTYTYVLPDKLSKAFKADDFISLESVDGTYYLIYVQGSTLYLKEQK